MNLPRWKSFVSIALVTVIFTYLNNASWLLNAPSHDINLIAHRGVHQTYSKIGLENDACTADRIHRPTHSFQENTLASIQKSFELGARMVEIDIHPTSDGHFAVFHDWTLDCRTEASGVTRKHTLSYLQTLDIGYGYTADGGNTYPFRGQGIGLMPSLTEVFDRFSHQHQHFLINIKSNSATEGQLLADFLLSRPEKLRSRIMVYGGDRPIERFSRLLPEVRVFSKKSVKACLKKYALIAWLGLIPAECKDTVLLLPENYAPYLWGWPRSFVHRMDASNTIVILVGWEDGHTDGIDNADRIKAIAKDFSGYIWTDKI